MRWRRQSSKTAKSRPRWRTRRSWCRTTRTRSSWRPPIGATRASSCAGKATSLATWTPTSGRKRRPVAKQVKLETFFDHKFRPENRICVKNSSALIYLERLEWNGGKFVKYISIFDVAATYCERLEKLDKLFTPVPIEILFGDTFCIFYILNPIYSRPEVWSNFVSLKKLFYAFVEWNIFVRLGRQSVGA